MLGRWRDAAAAPCPWEHSTQLADSQKEVRRLGQLLQALEAAGAGDPAAFSRGSNDDDDDGARRVAGAWPWTEGWGGGVLVGSRTG
jgi:hypothetical protein